MTALLSTKRVAQRNSVGVPERVKINGIDEAHLAASFAADDAPAGDFSFGTTAARSKLGNLLSAAR